jgi:hypothetical protein
VNNSTLRGRQITYCIVILGLFSAIAFYSPRLERIKREKDLGEATIGAVDTGSFMLKLAMIGGARGVAANVLWSRAVELQKRQEWDQLKSTADLISKLQPHFLAIWTFQGWNLSYNVSVEWDDPADKYVWIKNGIKFLEEGVDRNPKTPDLAWDTAWTYYHKIGFSDEAIVLRREFYDDDDDAFKTDPITKDISDDNFLVSRGWFESAVAKAETAGGRTRISSFEAPVEYVDPVANRKGRPGDLAFQSMPAHAATRYAQGLEKKSIRGIRATFGDAAIAAWSNALAEWDKFGDQVFPSHNAVKAGGVAYGQPIRLNDAMDPAAIAARGNDPDYWQRLLSDWNKAEVGKVSPEEAKGLADNQWYWTDRWASQMNFPYWKARSQAEMERDGMRARQLFYNATQAYLKANFREAVGSYQEGLELLGGVLDKHPRYRDDEMNKQDLAQIVARYMDAMKQAGMELPAELPFAELIKDASPEHNPDPFDALEMLGPAAVDEADKPR